MANPSPTVPLAGAVNQIYNKTRLMNQTSGRDPKSLGVHSVLPLATAKELRFRKGRHHEFEDTMARMFMQIPTEAYDAFLASLEDPETRTIATYLTGDDVKKGGIGYIDFLLHSVQHQFTEKVQIVETLSDNYVAFFFGTQAPTFQYQGTLLNTFEDDWTMRMFRIFRDLGRGTMLARRGLLLRLKYDSMIVSGAMLNFQWQLNAGATTYCPFGFDLLVKNVSIIYGNVAPPTNLHMFDNNFAPEGYHLEDSSGGGGAASQVFFGAPPAMPEGVSNAAAAPPTDSTGTPSLTPP